MVRIVRNVHNDRHSARHPEASQNAYRCERCVQSELSDMCYQLKTMSLVTLSLLTTLYTVPATFLYLYIKYKFKFITFCYRTARPCFLMFTNIDEVYACVWLTIYPSISISNSHGPSTYTLSMFPNYLCSFVVVHKVQCLRNRRRHSS